MIHTCASPRPEAPKDLHQLLVSLLDDLPENLPVLVLTTVTADLEDMAERVAPLLNLVSHSSQIVSPPRPADLARLVAVHGQSVLRLPTEAERVTFIKGL